MSQDWMATVVDWDTYRIQYEVMGDSLRKIAYMHDIPYESLKQVAEEEGWSQEPPSPENLKKHLKDVIQLHKSKLTLAALYRDMALFPELNKIEGELISKLKATLGELDPADPKTPNALRALAQTVSALTDRKIINASVQHDEYSDEDFDWTIEIVEAKHAINNLNKQLPASVANA